MPPVTKAGGSAFRKDIAFAETKDSDEYELEATGVVMVPDKADLQNDFAREETIQSFADQFETFAEAEQAGGGIMHAVWPDGWMDLTRNEILDEAEDIGGQTVDAGAWIQRWGIDHADLAELIREDILSGYSIGAIQVDWDGPFEQDEVDDVDTSEIPDEELVWELTDGIIREVSAVDIPAVPDAQILEAAKDYQKRLADHVGNPDAFIEEAMERGHSEAEAERLWDILNDAMEADGATEPGKQSVLARAGKAFLNTLTGSGDDSPTVAETPNGDPRRKDVGDFQADVFRVTAPEEDPDDYEDDVLGIGVDFPKSDVYVDWRNEVFSDELDNPHVSVYGSIADLEQATGNDTEQLDTLDAATAKMMFNVDPEELANKDAPEGDTSESQTTDMSDSDGGGDDKTLAEKNAEQINELTQAVENLTESITGPQPKTAEIEIDGETYEVHEDAAKAALGIDEETDVGEAIERLNEKAERVDEVEERLDRITRQSGLAGQSDQIRRSANGDGGEDDEPLDNVAKLLS